MKKTWASVIQNPAVFMKVNGWMTVVWLFMVPVSVVMGWVNSVAYVSALSIYALVTGHLSTWQAARVEVRQEIEQEKKDDNFEARLEGKVDRIDDQTG